MMDYHDDEKAHAYDHGLEDGFFEGYFTAIPDASAEEAVKAYEKWSKESRNHPRR